MDSSSSPELKISVATVYYQDQLKTLWFGVERSKMYEYDLMHGINCICCSKILQSGNGEDRPRPKSRLRMRMGRKPGGHNKK